MNKMKVVLFLILTLMPVAAFGTVCVSARSGDWSNPATWTNCGGSYPRPADSFLIDSSHSIVVSSVIATAGGTLGNVAATGNASLTIVKGGVLTLAGPVTVANTVGGTTTLTINGGGKLDLGGNQLLLGIGTGSGTVRFLVNGTAWSVGNFGEIVGVGGSNISTGSNFSRIIASWDYAKFSGMATAVGGQGNRLWTGSTQVHSIRAHNCRFLNCGSWQFGGNTWGPDTTLDFYAVDFRSIAARTTSVGGSIAFMTSALLPTTGTRSFSKITIDGINPGIVFNTVGANIADNALAVYSLGSATVGGLNTLSRNQIMSRSTFSDVGNWWLWGPTGGDRFDQCILVANNVNNHGIHSNTVVSTPDLYLTNSLIQAMFGGPNPVMGNKSVKFHINNNIILGGDQNFNETHHDPNNDMSVEQNTFILDPGTFYPVWKVEGYVPPLGKMQFRNNIYYTTAAAGKTVRLGGISGYWETGADPIDYWDYNDNYAVNGAIITDLSPAEVIMVDSYEEITAALFAKISTDSFSITKAGTDLSSVFTVGTWIKLVDAATSVPFTRKVLSSGYAADVTTVILNPANELTGGTINVQRAVPAAIAQLFYATALRSYGKSTGFSAHTTTLDPMFRGGRTSLTLSEYVTTALGATGLTLENYIDEAVKLNGLDKDGNEALFNPLFESTVVMGTVRDYYRIQNPLLATAGEGGTYLGAVPPTVVSGNILDAGTGAPVTDVSVTIDTQTVQSDSGGSYLAIVPVGDDPVTVERSGYVTQRALVTATDGRTTVQNFSLVRQKYPANLLFSGSGAGTVTSSPTGISCGSACSADFVWNTPLTLTASPLEYSLFTGWSGGLCGGIMVDCTFPLLAATTVTANFTLDTAHAVRGDGPPQQYYASLQDAFDTAHDGILRAWGVEFTGNCFLDRFVAITLLGGEDAGYAVQSGLTTIRGMLTVGKGTLVADRVVIR